MSNFWGPFFYVFHKSLVDYLAQVIYAKNCPTTFYCIFQLVSRVCKESILVQTLKCSLLIMGLHTFDIKLW